MPVQGVAATEKLIGFVFDVMDLCAKKVERSCLARTLGYYASSWRGFCCVT